MDYMVELIGGRVFRMSPSPVDDHQKVVIDLTLAIGNYFHKKKCYVRIAPSDVYFPKKGQHWKEAEDVVQPDLYVVCDKSKKIRRGCVGAPDFLVEILSPATASKDLTHKKNLYEKHGVQEYWVVSIDERSVVRFVLENGKYQEELIENPSKIAPTLFPDLVIDFEEVFDDLMEYDD